MVNLKDNVWIEGFDMHEVGHFMVTKDRNFIGDIAKKIIYSGKTSDIPEEMAKECVSFHFSNECKIYYNNYSKIENIISWQNTAKESIQSACNQEYCIIFKK